MIWEVDENLDDMIDFDELQLTYFRNITDTTGNEPCFFFKLLEVRLVHAPLLHFGLFLCAYPIVSYLLFVFPPVSNF